jgi:hypothetical protein
MSETESVAVLRCPVIFNMVYPLRAYVPADAVSSTPGSRLAFELITRPHFAFTLLLAWTSYRCKLQPAILEDDRVDHFATLHTTPRQTIQMTGITRQIEALLDNHEAFAPRAPRRSDVCLRHRKAVRL